MNGNYKKKLLKQQSENLIALEDLKFEKHYNQYDYERFHGIIYFVAAICLLAGFIIGYLIK